MTYTADLVEQCYRTVDRIREAYAWLTELAEPGRADPPSRRLQSDASRDRWRELAALERLDRVATARMGLAALPVTPAAARISVLDAQVAVYRHVREAVCEIAATRRATYVGRRGSVGVMEMLVWLDTGYPARWVAGPPGPVWRVLPQAPALEWIRSVRLAAAVDELLRDADQVARSAAGDTIDHRIPLDGACPVCGRRGSLYVVRRGPSWRWYAGCSRPACRCTGDDCPCLRAGRRAGTEHVWPRGDWDGPAGLLTLAGLDAT